MKRSQLYHGFLLLLLHLQVQLHHQLISAQLTSSSSASLSTTWTPRGCMLNNLCSILENSFGNVNLTCGFDCRSTYVSGTGMFEYKCAFAVKIQEWEILWSANRDRPVGVNATLQLTHDGDLVLKDADGSLVWSTNTAGKNVVGMKLTERANLVLFNANHAVVWQSFDHPTDTLLSGQSLLKGQRLTADASDRNSTRGPIFITSVSDWFGAFVDSDPPRLYFNISNYPDDFPNVTDEALTFVATYSSSSDHIGPTFQFLKLDYDGHIKVYRCVNSSCSVIADKTGQYLGYCDYPTVCGPYGICSSGLCTCPDETSFRPVSAQQPELGCFPVATPSCESHQELLEFGFVGSFISAPSRPDVTTLKSCWEACLNNCSCKAALFQPDSQTYHYNGSCFLQHEVFSFKESLTGSAAFIKVQIMASASKSSRSLIVRATIGAVVGMLVIIGIAFAFYRKTRTGEEMNNGEEDLLQLTGMPTGFSYEYMRSTTKNFDKRLGGGGFGSVFDGALADGTRVAIKQLETITQGKKEFLAEVETIGSIHHLNLVRLLGFCAEKSHRLLVYEHMSNGSLDKWIFRKENNHALDWEVLRKIIHQVAKGLSYLHEECRRKIAHLDIKPENILLDSNFNAKVSDFGLAKLIDRDQSAVKTTVRGTPGYLAPEWLLTSMITEKVDVYSFGVVVVEIVCGRKNVDFSNPEGCVHLLPLIKDKAMAGELLDVIDERKRDVQRDGKDLEKMLKLAIWCVQYDPRKRPSMSTVVKVLEGTTEITPDLDYNFDTPVPNLVHKIDDHSSGSAPLIPSVLSGPR